LNHLSFHYPKNSWWSIEFTYKSCVWWMKWP
jgi:hypothetical protein